MFTVDAGPLRVGDAGGDAARDTGRRVARARSSEVNRSRKAGTGGGPQLVNILAQPTSSAGSAKRRADMPNCLGRRDEVALPGAGRFGQAVFRVRVAQPRPDRRGRRERRSRGRVGRRQRGGCGRSAGWSAVSAGTQRQTPSRVGDQSFRRRGCGIGIAEATQRVPSNRPRAGGPAVSSDRSRQ